MNVNECALLICLMDVGWLVAAGVDGRFRAHPEHVLGAVNSHINIQGYGFSSRITL